MKQTALALLLMVSLAPQASTQVGAEFYGEFRYSYNRADAGDSTRWASANNASRLGVRGEVPGERLTAFFDLQTGVSIDADGGGSAFTQRYYLAGVRGAFGTVTVGRHSTAYKVAGSRLDPFFDTSTLSAGGGVPTTGLFGGASFGLSNLTNGWADRTVAYVSPTRWGLVANAAAYLDTDSDHEYGVGLAYRAHGVDVGVQYHDANGAGKTWVQTVGVDHALRGHAGYSRAGVWSLGASCERLEARSGDHQDFFYGVGTFNVSPSLLLAGAVGYVQEGGAVQPVSGTGYHAGVFYTLVPQARVHVLYSRVDADVISSRANLAMGLTYQFSLRP